MFRDERLKRVSFSRINLVITAAIFAAVGGYILWQAFAASTYYVSPGGSGVECSQANPCDFGTGVGKLSSGDTLVLENGDYGSLPPIDGAHFSSQVTINGTRNAILRQGLTVNNSDRITLSGLSIIPNSATNSSLQLTGATNNITVDGVKVSGGVDHPPTNARIALNDDTDQFTLKNSDLSFCATDATVDAASGDTYPACLQTAGTNLTISGNTFHDSQSHFIGDHVGKAGQTTGGNITITGNTFSSNLLKRPACGAARDKTCPMAIKMQAGENWTIEHNFFGQNANGADIRILPNTNGYPDLANPTIRSNIFYSTGAGNGGIEADGTHRSQYNESGDLIANAKIINNTFYTGGAALDFHDSWGYSDPTKGVEPPGRPKVSNNIFKSLDPDMCKLGYGLSGTFGDPGYFYSNLTIGWTRSPISGDSCLTSRSEAQVNVGPANLIVDQNPPPPPDVAANYAPTAGSTNVINKANGDAPNKDFNDCSRRDAPDLGAIEYNADCGGGNRTYYISPGGNGTECSQTSRCTWATAIGAAQPGDTISLEGVDWPDALGISNKNYGPGELTVTGPTTAKIRKGLTIDNSHNVTLSGFTVTPSDTPCTPIGCHSNLVINNASTDVTVDNLIVKGVPVFVSPNPWVTDTVHHTYDKQGGGPHANSPSNIAQIELGIDTQNITIKNSDISDCAAKCVQLDYDAGPPEKMPDQVTIQNNVFSSSSFPGVKNHFIGSTASHITISGNHFAQLLTDGVCNDVDDATWQPGDNPNNYNNGCAHSGPEHIRISSGANWSVNDNWFGDAEEDGPQVRIWRTDDVTSAADSVIISSNIFHSDRRSKGTGIDLEGGCGARGNPPTNVQLINNTIIADHNGIGLGNSFDGCVAPVRPLAANNIMAVQTADGCSRLTLDTNLAKQVAGGDCGPQVTVGDPLLDANDAPQASSVLAIDKVHNGYAPSTDYFGRSRVGLPDIGAIEYLGPDDQLPTVSITNPSNGAIVQGTIDVNAAASDNIGVAGVQFKLDTGNLGFEDTIPPYSINWDTTTASNGSHTLTATARDGAGNSATSTPISVTVNNVPPPTCPPDCPPPETFPVGDLNHDRQVDVLDLSILLSHYGTPGSALTGDINGEGGVDVIDLSILLSHYGT